MDNMQLWLISSTDSINLNSGADGFYLNPDLDGLTGLPEIRSSNGVNGGYDGGWTSTQLWGARLITIRGLIVDKDGSAVETKRKQLAKLVGQGKKDPLTLKFVSEAGRTYTCTVRTTNCTMALQNVYSRQEYQIQLRADDPLLYDDGGDDVQATLRVQTDSEGFDIPFDIPLDISSGADPVVVDAGEDANYPIITMYGELHSPTIVNQTTNQQLQLGADLGGSSLEWTEFETASGSAFQITSIEGAPLTLTELKGNATQDGTPTPDAPVAVNTTTGENVAKITGKNLIDQSLIESSTFHGLTISATPEKISVSGTTDANYPAWVFYPDGTVSQNQWWPAASTVNVSKGQFCDETPHTFSINIGGASVAYQKIAYFVGYMDGTYSGNMFIPTGATSVKFTTAKAVNYIAFGFKGNSETFDNTLQLQLETGSQASAFEPYQNQDFEVNLGKNLLDPSWMVAGYMTAIGGTITYTQTQGEMACEEYIPVEPNTEYTFEIFETTDTYPEWFGISQYSTADTSGFIERSVKTSVNPQTWFYTIRTKTNTHYIRPSARNLQHATKYMLSKGGRTSYAPYFTPIELCKIGNYQDRIYKNDGKWYVEKQIGKVVLDGSEDWYYATSSGGYFQLGNSYGSLPFDGNPATNALCDHFICRPRWHVASTTSYNLSINMSGLLTAIRYQEVTTLADFKAWLASNPTTVYYALATPTTTEITDSTLLSQLNFIANLYGGTNNIMLVGTGAQGEIGVKYGTGYIEIPADVAVIDCKDRTVMLNGANAYNLLAEGSEFIRLAPGENKLYLTSESTSDSGYAEVKFKTGNLSI